MQVVITLVSLVKDRLHLPSDATESLDTEVGASEINIVVLLNSHFELTYEGKFEVVDEAGVGHEFEVLLIAELLALVHVARLDI